MKPYKELLKFKDEKSAGAIYRLTFGMDKLIIKDEETAEESLARVTMVPQQACFSSYLRLPSSYSEEIKRAQYYPLHLNLKDTLHNSRTEGDLNSLKEVIPGFLKLHEQYIDDTIKTLSAYIDIVYNKKTSIISILPRKEYYRVEMIAILTKLRTIFEEYFVFAGVGASFFREQFPELNDEEISYLLNVFIFYSSGGHSLYVPSRSYSPSGDCSVYMSFKDIMREAGTGKHFGVNTSIVEKKMYEISSGSTRYSMDSLDRYQRLLEHKDTIINNFIKQNGTKKSVFTRTKQKDFSVA